MVNLTHVSLIVPLPCPRARENSSFFLNGRGSASPFLERHCKAAAAATASSHRRIFSTRAREYFFFLFILARHWSTKHLSSKCYRRCQRVELVKREGETIGDQLFALSSPLFTQAPSKGRILSLPTSRLRVLLTIRELLLWNSAIDRSYIYADARARVLPLPAGQHTVTGEKSEREPPKWSTEAWNSQFLFPPTPRAHGNIRAAREREAILIYMYTECA